tara:strand:+ start:175 stop:501 length:327 start_codon:yes stop_codon:yes gene_type:complete
MKHIDHSDKVDEDEYPAEAVPLGTIIRSKKIDRLGVIVDGFYEGDLILYTCLFIPNTVPGSYYHNLLLGDNAVTQVVVREESEFDLIYYLMIGPVDIDNFEFVQESRG